MHHFYVFRPKCCTTPISSRILGYELGDEWTLTIKCTIIFICVAAQSELVTIEDYEVNLMKVVNLHM